jgi:predicted permease
MTSLSPHSFDGSPSEALSYLHDKGSDLLSTPSPGVHLAGALAIAGIGTWASVALLLDHPVAGGFVALATAVLAFLDLLPAVYTLTHREYAGRYLAARMTYGDAHARLHPFVVLVGFPALCFLALAYGGPSGAWVAWGLLGAAAGLALSLVRVHHARQSVAMGRSTAHLRRTPPSQ